MKLNPLNQKMKKLQKLFREREPWREPYLFIFTFSSHQLCKKPIQKNYSTENKTYARQLSFSAIFILNKIMAAILLIIHIRNKTHERSAEVLNEGVKSKLISKFFLLFDITVKEGRNLRGEVEKGLNWMKFIRSDLNEKKLGQCTY